MAASPSTRSIGVNDIGNYGKEALKEAAKEKGIYIKQVHYINVQ